MTQQILLLGSDAGTTLACRSGFAKVGMTVASAEIVEPVADFIRLAQPAAVLLDVSRADLDGEALLRRVSGQLELKQLPVFALTSTALAEKANGSERIGMIRVFDKLATKLPDIIARITDAIAGAQDPGKAAANSGQSPALGLNGGDPPSSGTPSETFRGLTPPAFQPLSELYKSLLSGSETERVAVLAEMQEKVRELRRSSLAAARHTSTAFTSAVARLLMVMANDVARIDSAWFGTLCSAIETMAAAAAAPAGTSAEQLPIRVLLVDQDPLSRRGLLLALASPDLEVIEVSSAEKALTLVRESVRDVLFMHETVLAASGAGATLAQALRQEGIPLVLVSAGHDHGKGPSFLNVCPEVLVKPFTMCEVVVRTFTLALKRRLGCFVRVTGMADPPLLLKPASLEEASRTSEDKATARFEELSRHSDQLEEQLKAQAVDRLELSSSKAKAEADASAAVRRVAELENELRESAAAHEEGQKRVQLVQQRLSELEPALAVERAEHLRLEAQDQEWRAREQKMEQQLRQHAEQEDNLKVLLGRALDERAQLEAKVKERQERPASDTLEPQSPATSAETRLDELHLSAELRRQLSQTSARDVLAQEFSQTKAELLERKLSGHRLQTRVSELEACNARIEGELQLLMEKDRFQRNTVQALQAQLERAEAKLGAAEAELQAATREVRQLQLRSAELETQAESWAGQVRTQVNLEQSWRQHEAELNVCILKEAAQLANAKAALAAEDAELRRAKDKIQSMLSRITRELELDKTAAAGQRERRASV